MKKDRNCNMPYPAYPPYAMPVNPGMAMPMNAMGTGIPGGAMPAYQNTGVSANTLEEQMNNLQGQINMLDKRVSNLENALATAKTNLNDSNYHIM